jgi:hypothetical protein
MTLSLSYKGEISPFGRDDKKNERWPRDKTIVFQEFLWGFDEHSEAESTKDVKKALVDSMPEICSSGCSEERGARRRLRQRFDKGDVGKEGGRR